jgi:transposase
MPKQHTEDYKLTAVKYYLSHKNKDLKEVCKIFDCKFQSLSRWVKKYQSTKSLKRKPKIKKSYKITEEIRKFVKSVVYKHPTITLWEISKEVNDKFKVKLYDTSIYNILKELKITRKKVRTRYFPETFKGEEKQSLDDFYNRLKRIDYKKIISLDESSIYLNMTLSYGRNKSGLRLYKKTNKYPFKRYNLLCAIRYNKVVGWTLYEELKGGVKKEELVEFYNHFIKDKYKDHVILLDNARPHTAKIVKEAIESSGNKIMFSVRYNPETNPIEEYFSQLKHYIRKSSPQSFNEIYRDIVKINEEKIKYI